MKIELQSQVIVTDERESVAEEIAQLCREEGVEYFAFLKEGNFLVQDAVAAMEKAYLASEKRQVILLGADSFSAIVQNKLLKVIEEPPPRKEFILLFRKKAEILPTIRSRLPVVRTQAPASRDFDALDLRTMDIAAVYRFVQEKGRLDASEARNIIEGLVPAALRSGAYHLDEGSLDLFRDAIRALDVGSPPAFVLTAVLLKLLAKKKKKNIRGTLKHTS
ncbi:DNA polymerase III subunit delta' [Nitratifractor sp.]|uniref:DNA polymerase III subunit delta' n=1 Tax=Nitratifractor sp. TaxID=2268144 RepID=UPI0025CD8D55|nr:DNA polymerase III subunit delta' [Nitratifractor sp.]